MILGNTIKNYQKKKRRECKEAYKEIERIVHNKVINSLPPHLKEFKEKEEEIYKIIRNE